MKKIFDFLRKNGVSDGFFAKFVADERKTYGKRIYQPF